MSLMYVSRRASQEVTWPLCCVLWMENMINIVLRIYHTWLVQVNDNQSKAPLEIRANRCRFQPYCINIVLLLL